MSFVLVASVVASSLLGIGCILAVVSKRDRQRAAQLRKSEERYRLIVDNQTEFVVKWLPDGTRTFVNESYCRYFGVPERECVGTSFMPLVLPEFREAVSRKIASLTPARPEATDEHLSFVAGGGQRWQEWHDRGIFDDRGQLVRLLSTGRDITERKEVERKLAAAEAKAATLTRQLLAFQRQAIPAAGEVRHELSQSRKRQQAGTETLLLVEDEESVRLTSQKALQKRGYRVLVAANGEEASRIVADHEGPIDLLLTDVIMPGMSGRQLADTLQREFPRLYVLFMSGYTSGAVLQHGIEQSATNFLQKPFTPGDLAEKVRDVLDGPAAG